MRFTKKSTIVLAREQLPFHTFPFLLCSWVHEYPFGKISIFRGSNIWKVCEAEKSWWISCVLSIFLSAPAATSSLSLEPLPFAFLQTRPWKTSEFHLLTSKFKQFQTHFLAEKNSSEMLGRDAKEAPYIAAAVGAKEGKIIASWGENLFWFGWQISFRKMGIDFLGSSIFSVNFHFPKSVYFLSSSFAAAGLFPCTWNVWVWWWGKRGGRVVGEGGREGAGGSLSSSELQNLLFSCSRQVR